MNQTLSDDSDDGVARHCAELAGRLLVAERRSGGPDLGARGDRIAQAAIAGELARLRPGDHVLSEESADDRTGRRAARRVWIVDPLDGTRHYAGTDGADWSVHVALWCADAPGDGLAAAAVALPARGVVLDRRDPWPSGSGALGSVPARPRPRIGVSASRPPSFAGELAAALGADLVPAGSVGHKVGEVLAGRADAYVHAGGQYQWDSAAPVGVARAAGLHVSRVDGTAVVYNEDAVALPDLVVSRPGLAGPLMAALASSVGARAAS